MMSALTQDDRFEEVYKQKAEGKEIFTMCEVLDRVEARGEKRGISIGEKRGEKNNQDKTVQLIKQMQEAGQAPETILKAVMEMNTPCTR